MRAISYTQLPMYRHMGVDVVFYWDEQEHAPREDSIEPYWSYEFCRAKTTDSPDVLLETITTAFSQIYGPPVFEARADLGELARALVARWGRDSGAQQSLTAI
jgi:hypothetical protein